MSSATSTSAGEVRVKADTTAPLKPDASFRSSHFFVLASLIAATGAVIVSRQSTPEHLVLISITIASAGLAAAGFYQMLSPLMSAGTVETDEPMSARARGALQREKLLVLRSLKDLEFDRSMGKLSQADFDEMAARLRARALSLMKQLDEDGSGYRAIIERELTARLAAHAAVQLAAGQRPAAADTPRVEEPPPLTPVGLCACGTTNDPDAVFCKRCGTKLTASPAATDRPR
jgi:hypothetical protein